MSLKKWTLQNHSYQSTCTYFLSQLDQFQQSANFCPNVKARPIDVCPGGSKILHLGQSRATYLANPKKKRPATLRFCGTSFHKFHKFVLICGFQCLSAHFMLSKWRLFNTSSVFLLSGMDLSGGRSNWPCLCRANSSSPSRSMSFMATGNISCSKQRRFPAERKARFCHRNEQGLKIRRGPPPLKFKQREPENGWSVDGIALCKKGLNFQVPPYLWSCIRFPNVSGSNREPEKSQIGGKMVEKHNQLPFLEHNIT